MALVTLRELRRRARARADFLLYNDLKGGTEPDYSSSFVPNEEINELINIFAKEYYNILTQADGEDYFTKTITASPEKTISLPEDFFKLQSVKVGDSSARRASEREFRNSKAVAPSKIVTLSYVPLLKTLASYIEWIPNTYDAGDSVIYEGNVYTSRITQFSILFSTLDWDLSTTEQATIDGFNGYEEYIVLRTAIALLRKEQNDTAELLSEFALVGARLSQLKEDRDESAPDMIQDVRGDCFNEYGDYGGYFETSVAYRISGNAIHFMRAS